MTEIDELKRRAKDEQVAIIMATGYSQPPGMDEGWHSLDDLYEQARAMGDPRTRAGFYNALMRRVYSGVLKRLRYKRQVYFKSVE